jgi:DNA-binding response OmpR family regulator
MSDENRRHTALGVARERFIEGLARKAAELKGAVALLVASPDSERPREEMRRRLHALYASAQVFRMQPLADVLEDCLKRLDASRDEGRALTQDDLDALASLAVSLPRIGAEAESSPRPSAAPPAPVRRSEPLAAISVTPAEPPARARTDAVVVSRPASVVPAAPGEPPNALRVAETTAIAGPDTSAVVSVLVVEGSEAQARIRAALPAATYEVIGTAAPDEGLRLARSGAPDVILASRAALVRGDGEFVARLRADLLTDFIPVILLAPPGTAVDPIAARGLGADDVVGLPVDPPLLVRAIARVLGSDAPAGVRPLGDATLGQLAERLAQEVRDGLAGAAEIGGDLPVPLGDGAEVLAAAWAAIARVRAHVAARSGGRVRFRDPPRRGAPAVLALTDGEDALADDATEVSLDGRRALVVDDDPAVVWFFSGLLREAGATVREASDGREALARLRAERADVVISDIVMPHLDGFGLCRALQRDPALEGVPVILLSWKEDLLQRMRDLQAGASGYLRKESGATQILARVRDALRPLARLEAQLRAGGEVRGSLERIGVSTLLRTVASVCGDARVTVRDAWNLFEIDLRGGELVHLTRTATDGSFARGEVALRQLLGASAGRFVVAPGEPSGRITFHDPLDVLLERGTQQLGALVDAVSGPGLPLADRVELDEDVLAPLLRTSPAPSRALIERLRGGESPRALVVSGEHAPQDVEAVLVDLARRGALRSVRGHQGEDRVAEALAARLAELQSARAVRALPASPALSLPPPPVDPTALPSAVSAATEPVAEATLPGTLPSPGAPPNGDGAASEEPGTPEAGAGFGASEYPPASEEDVTSGSLYPEPLRDDAIAAAPPEAHDTLRMERKPRAPVASDEGGGDEAVGEDAAGEYDAADDHSRSEDVEAPADAATDDDAKFFGGGSPADEERALEAPEGEPHVSTGPSGALWLVILGSLAVLGFFGYRAWYDGTLARLLGVEPPALDAPEANPRVDAGAAVPTSAAAPGDAGRPGEIDAGSVAAPVAAPVAALASPVDPLRFGRVVPGIADTTVTVADGEGLLVVEAGEGAPAIVSVDGVERGRAPLKLPVPAGQHEISFRRGEETRYRFLNLRAAHTHTVTPP